VNTCSEEQDRVEIPIEAVDNCLQDQAKCLHLTSDRKLCHRGPDFLFSGLT